MRRLTNEIIDQRLENRPIKRGEDYAGAKIKIIWICLDCSWNWLATPDSIININKSGCPNCAGNLSLTNKIIDKRLSGRSIKRIGDCIGALRKIMWGCLDCFYEWHATPASVLDIPTGCPNCAGNARLTNEIIDQRLIGKNIKRAGNYTGVDTKMPWECLECKHIWTTVPAAILYLNEGCPKCGGNAPLSNEIIDERLIGRNIKRLEDYKGYATKIWWECPICNHKWQATPSNIDGNGKGCPMCNIPGLNEQLMHQLLKQHNIKYEPQFNIKNINKEERPLIFDAYLPLLKLAIEYNGKQHYVPTGFFSGDPSGEFVKQQERDEHKRAFCKKNGIELVEIDGRKLHDKSLENYLLLDLIPFIKKKSGIQ